VPRSNPSGKASAPDPASANGSFSVAGIAPGAYDVEVKHAQALSRRANGVVFIAGVATTQNFATLLAGDVDGNNAVTIIDFSILRASFGLAQGQTGYDARADLNENGAVDILDFSLLRANFGLAGPVTAGATVTRN
jgi:hypothetical protein